MFNYPTFSVVDSAQLRDAFALAITQGYLAKNSIPATDNRDQFVEKVWSLADELVAARTKSKAKPQEP